MSDIGATEWGTDCWGDILSESSEEHARKVATFSGRSLYSRSPMGAWTKVEE